MFGFGKFGVLVLSLVAVGTQAYENGVDALEDGVVDEDEVESAALDLSTGLGDVLCIKVRGQDIISDKCQNHLVQGLSLLGHGVATALLRDEEADEDANAILDSINASKFDAALDGVAPPEIPASIGAHLRGPAARAFRRARQGVAMARAAHTLASNHGELQAELEKDLEPTPAPVGPSPMGPAPVGLASGGPRGNAQRRADTIGPEHEEA